jgi:hypothetical protein
MQAADEAFIVHRTPTRIRMKIPHRRRQEAYFAELKRDVMKQPGVVAVHVNALSASMVIECGNSLKLLAGNPRFGGLELFDGEPSLPADNPLVHSVRGDDLNELQYGDAIGLIGILIKIIVAIATKQLGVQLTEWVFAVAAQSARREAAAIAARRRPLRARPIFVLVRGD